MFVVRGTRVRVRCFVRRSDSERVRVCVRGVRGSVFGHCCVVFGVRFRCCVLFVVRASQLSESCPDDDHKRSSFMMIRYDI